MKNRQKDKKTDKRHLTMSKKWLQIKLKFNIQKMVAQNEVNFNIQNMVSQMKMKLKFNLQTKLEMLPVALVA